MASEQKSNRELHKIVIVGGGAGGLELATQLGRTLGRRRQALITLVDRSRTHLWKPLLHQVAAGSMDLNDHELDYLYQARWHHFQFRLGRIDGLDRINPEQDIQITIVEAAPKILPALSERLSTAVLGLLKKLRVEVLTGERVTELSSSGVKAATGREIPAELVVWAAGIKAPDFLKDIGALETNRINQLVVTQTLQTTRDPNIFA